ncbi:hypothetical protein OSB04_001715 [Centaurea solstitialis]|uniref:non-specific serine/threonine protein kinase n=1 Tax=Centaurea solstitialis TaxID=347529 RepID=A0AA38TTB1_9ASTR|nr:hypothetical protein OSB04_001715 [Centaurea solstitialis]
MCIIDLIILSTFSILKIFLVFSQNKLVRDAMDVQEFDFGDVERATNYFSEKNVIREGSLGKVYKGELLRPGGRVTYAFKRLRTRGRDVTLELFKYLSKIKHENIYSPVGYCVEKNVAKEKLKWEVLIYEFPSRGSLDLYLSKEELTWLKRLNICLGVVRGLSYLHDVGLVHGNLMSKNILLDDNWEAKLANFNLAQGFEVVFSRGECWLSFSSGRLIVDDIVHWHYRTGDPTEDIYSLGTVLFQALCGKPTPTREYMGNHFLSSFARFYYAEGTFRDIIDPTLRKQMSQKSFDIFSAISYRCLHHERPKIHEIVNKIEEALEHQLEFENVLVVAEQKRSFQQQQLKIPLKEIQLATNGFHADHLIGRGGFGGVYKAELLHLDVRNYVKMNNSHRQSIVENFAYQRIKSKVAVKKLDNRYGQGTKQFLQEIEVLSVLNHQNIVPLLGFCDEDGEMILVYEYASNGSLDRHIGKIGKVYGHTWAQRLQICLDVAHGLKYLHEMDIIHRDIKSANILIGDTQEGMIGDFGLSRVKKNTNVEFSVTDVAGTPGYVEPKYARTGMVSKQTDIYSLGVVLLEVFCGRLAISPTLGDDPEYLLHQAKRHFQQKTFNQMIDPYLNEEFEKSRAISENTSVFHSIIIFAEITYKCLHNDQAHQLTMADVVKELKKAWAIYHVSRYFFHNDLKGIFTEERVEMLSTEIIQRDITDYTNFTDFTTGKAFLHDYKRLFKWFWNR